MLVTRIVGDCPGCGRRAAFGNISVSGTTLVRGCPYCKYCERLPLPVLSKQILYLDQSFFSHAFRAGLREFVDAAQLIGELAHAQVLVCPRSSIHETETHQWRHPQQQLLWEFIKKTSRGHEFAPEYKVRRIQIARGFEQFIDGADAACAVAVSDALSSDVNDWDDYYWIDVPYAPGNIERTRQLKEESVKLLVAAFPKWRSATTTFEEDFRSELAGAAHGYLRLYREMADRLAGGDFMAAVDSPLDAMVVKTLLMRHERSMSADQRMSRVLAYFGSSYFGEVPCESLSAKLFAVLRDRVKRGQYQTPDKAEARLAGFHYDVQAVAGYGPYCHAIFVDSAMLDFVLDSRVGLTTVFGTRVFARSNWNDFLTYLESLRSKTTAELRWAVQLVDP